MATDNHVLVWDTETTDLPDWKTPSEAPEQPHLVQLAAVLLNTDTGKIAQSMDVIIRPDGWVSAPEAFELHGITTLHSIEVGIPEKLALEMFLAMWNGHQRIAFNTTFDNRIIRIGTKRYFDEQTIDRWHQGKQGVEWSCMMLAARKIMGGKQPTLQEAYFYFTGKELVGAHTAMADTLACLEVYKAINAQGAVPIAAGAQS